MFQALLSSDLEQPATAHGSPTARPAAQLHPPQPHRTHAEQFHCQPLPAQHPAQGDHNPPTLLPYGRDFWLVYIFQLIALGWCSPGADCLQIHLAAVHQQSSRWAWRANKPHTKSLTNPPLIISLVHTVCFSLLSPQSVILQVCLLLERKQRSLMLEIHCFRSWGICLRKAAQHCIGAPGPALYNGTS